jgi:hypothetical protein
MPHIVGNEQPHQHRGIDDNKHALDRIIEGFSIGQGITANRGHKAN